MHDRPRRNSPKRQLEDWRSGRSLGFGLLAMLAASATSAQAGGLYIQEFATSSMGTANAGAQAWADDASVAWSNPAGMARLERSEIAVGVGVARSKLQFDADADTPAGGNDGGDAGSTAPLGQINGVYNINDRWSAGISVGGITGAAIDYRGGWAGRYQAEDVSLTVIGVNPSLAFKVKDWLSIGGGPVFSYGTLDYELAAPPPAGTGQVDIEDADDTDITGRVGALFSLGERTRLGVVYQSETELDMDGKTTVNPVDLEFNASLKLIFPQYVQVGGYHQIDDRWALLASARWEDWSSFDEIPVSTERGDAAIPRNWNDTYGVNLGVHFRATDDLLLQAGFAYDTSPVSDGNRTADMPVDRQIRVAAGLQYSLSERATVGGSLVYADLGDADIDADTVRGSYDNNQAIFAAVNFAWKF